MTQSVDANPTNNRIKKLPPLLVNQLAAGEVVTRPASVVKELIENAIDAGAKSIDVRITQGGMGIIEVVDDGCGIHADDMVMAVTRFATSKIADVAHLQGIATLGFRGEALAATAAVSRLTLKSSADDSGIGRELNVAGILEDTPQLRPVVHPRGTTVTVKDLYFNVPARRGNLKSISTEYAQIELVVKHLAMVASDVSFSLWHNDKRRFNLQAVQPCESTGLSYSTSYTTNAPPKTTFNNRSSKDLNIAPSGSSLSSSEINSSIDSAKGSSKDSFSDSLNNVEGQPYLNTPLMQTTLARLRSVLPPSQLQSSLLETTNLQPVTINLEGLASAIELGDNSHHSLGIYGFLIPSQTLPANTGYKLIYINGRLVKDRRIAQCLRDCSSILSKKFDTEKQLGLGYVLFFDLPNSWLNLNVHPSKQCIKIQNLANIMAHLEIGVRDALNQWQRRQPPPITSSVKDNSSLKTRIDIENVNSINDSIKNDSSKVEEPLSVYRYVLKNDKPQTTTSFNNKKSDGVNVPLSGLSSRSDAPVYASNRPNGQRLSSLLTYQIECLAVIPRTELKSIDNFSKDRFSKNRFSKDNYLSDIKGIELESDVVLVKIEQALYLCSESDLISSFQSNNLTCQLISANPYSQSVSIEERLSWLNHMLRALLDDSAFNHADNLAEWKESLIKNAIHNVSFEQLTLWMLNQARG